MTAVVFPEVPGVLCVMQSLATPNHCRVVPDTTTARAIAKNPDFVLIDSTPWADISHATWCAQKELASFRMPGAGAFDFSLSAENALGILDAVPKVMPMAEAEAQWAEYEREMGAMLRRANVQPVQTQKPSFLLGLIMLGGGAVLAVVGAMVAAALVIIGGLVALAAKLRRG